MFNVQPQFPPLAATKPRPTVYKILLHSHRQHPPTRFQAQYISLNVMASTHQHLLLEKHLFGLMMMDNCTYCSVILILLCNDHAAFRPKDDLPRNNSLFVKEDSEKIKEDKVASCARSSASRGCSVRTEQAIRVGSPRPA